MRKYLWFLFILISCLLAACGPSEEEIATMTAAAWTDTPIPTNTPTITPTATQTSTPTLTPTPQFSATPSETPTPEPTTALSLGNVYCRWGPGKAYRGSGVVFHKDDVALVEGKRITGDGTWFWINMDDVDWNCWVNSSMLELSVEHKAVKLVHVAVPVNNSVPSPSGVHASRSGNTVTIAWSPAPSAPELEYLLEAIICTKEGYNLEVAYGTTNTSMTFTDATNCSMASFGTLRVANKLGYSTAVKILWP